MQCALNYVSQVKDPATALGFLRSVMKLAKEDQVTVDHVKEQIRKEFAEDPTDILGNSCVDKIGEISVYFKSNL